MIFAVDLNAETMLEEVHVENPLSTNTSLTCIGVQIDPTCTPKLNKVVPAVFEAQSSVFHYPDMATTRAGIGAATIKPLVDRVAIIGLGGTGSYILDLLAKTPVLEIHLFDGDEFELHNSFRAPGAPAKEDFTNPKKVDWFGATYDRMRKGIEGTHLLG